MENVKSGIYKITNEVNGKYYVGSSKNIRGLSCGRWKTHISKLNNGVHPNSHLQNAWNKYGKNVFVLEVVRKCSKTDLLLEEQKDLDIWVGKPECYNIREDAKCPVVPGSKRPDWVKEKISRSQRGKPRWTEEQRRQMSIDRKGRKHKPDTIAKFMNRKSSCENIRKAQLFNVGRCYSEEHKHNISVGKIMANRAKIGVQ